MTLAQAKHYTSSTLRWKYYVDTCVTLNARISPAAFATQAKLVLENLLNT